MAYVIYPYFFSPKGISNNEDRKIQETLAAKLHS